MVKYLRAANVKDGALDLTDVLSMNFTPNEQKTFSLRPGDVLVTEGSGSLRSVGASAVWKGEIGETICFQNTLLRLRPRNGVDGRYLSWWARSAFGSGVFASVASGANIYHLSAERVRALPVQLPGLEEQRRIADFLDAETAGIDRLTRARDRQLEVLTERHGIALDQAFSGKDFRPTRLKYLLAVKPRYGVLVPQFSDSGIRYIRVNDLLDLAGRAESLPRIPAHLSAQYSRTVTRAGDVLLSVVGTMGRSAVVPPELASANVARAVASLRTRRDVPPNLIATWLTTASFLRQAKDVTASDTAQPTLGMEDLANFRLSWPTNSRDQESLMRTTSEITRSQRSLVKALDSQRALLAERRQALITAAVTGQFDVSSASGRNVTEGV
ncbi:restriction endonuclease subunit S [Streptomyces zhihengii]